MTPANIPIVDVGPLLDRRTKASSKAERSSVARDMGRACRESGFFYIRGHGVDERLQERLEALSREFFRQPLEDKLSIRLELGGSAWRGFFPVGAELTLGRPDQKEGLYFGAELSEDHPQVLAKTPLHGPNLFPENIPGFRETVLAYMDAMTRLGHRLMEAVGESLGCRPGYFDELYTREPLVLFRIFNYPSMKVPVATDAARGLWSVAEHTDYGLLTILKQDDSGGLQVRSGADWIPAEPIPGTFVCNLGDMLERMTGGLYVSTPHRVRNTSGKDRLSFPFFFDPNFNAEVHPIQPGRLLRDDPATRWDGASVHDISGTYGTYLLSKVSKVFPDLGKSVL